MFAALKSTIQVVLITVLLLLVIEVIVRTTTHVGRLGTAKELFVEHAWLGSHGNAPKISATAFGIEVYTNEFGFRVDADEQEDPVKAGGILVLGDSVAFGVGVENEHIATTLVDDALDSVRVANAAVIGHSTFDHLNVARVLLAEDKQHFRKIILVFCLNDVSEASAQLIHNTRTSRVSLFESPRWVAAGFTGGPTIVERLRNNPLAKRSNDWLRARSNLYVLLRGLATDPQGRHWRSLLQKYQTLSSEDLLHVLAPIVEVQHLAAAHHTQLAVVMVPYAEQMKNADADLPQQLVADFLRAADVAYIDLRPDFLATREPESLFLPFDPVHLSRDGHKLLAAGILRAIEENPDPIESHSI